MKTLIMIPLAVALALLAAAGLCRAAGLHPHAGDVLTAACVAVIAAELALLPSWFFRRGEPVQVAQAALGGTVLHLLLTIMMAAAVMVARVVEPSAPFVYWLTGAYWLSLAGLVWGLVSFVPSRQVNSKGSGN